ncbi:unnamed protein product [Thlaspi arvense]|uniref:Phytocyanin domain-containing protein n=1 Tax=Thlaspi arvense TaxID=13288 RepID=A0AAU9T5C7_THLAR|nr:unnamed protein product [Thlaspi arvense]CAH2080119.1 unnamed protein product [Thlaspi arvense]
MMTTTTRTFCYVLVMISFTVLMGCCCSAKIYKVGDSDGWTTNDDSYSDWAKLKEFHVGDSLIFKYDRNFNDVTQVSGALEYEFCDSSSPTAVYNTGHDVVTLTEPGSYYFISSNHTRCLSGQRLDILVVHDPSHRIPQPPPRKIFPFGKTYNVGDSKEWRVPEESDFYFKWSEEKQFHVGDNLVFYYDNEVNDVLEISGDLEFISCDPTSPVSVHNTGQDLIRLTKPGIHYFISSKTGHCEAGLKLRVIVGPLPKAVPKKMMKLSPLDRLIKWLRTFKPKPHH